MASEDPGRVPQFAVGKPLHYSVVGAQVKKEIVLLPWKHSRTFFNSVPFRYIPFKSLFCNYCQSVFQGKPFWVTSILYDIKVFLLNRRHTLIRDITSSTYT